MKHIRIVLCLAFCFAGAWPALGQNATTTGTCSSGDGSILATDRAISVQCTYTGDANTNNSAALQYRVHGSPTWLNAFTPYNDRRPFINSSANPHYQEFRGSIVGLSANTQYDWQLTFSDADGVTGTNPLTGTVTTLNFSQTCGGATRNATPGTLTAVLTGTINAGDTVKFGAGTYSPFTISQGGNSGAWVCYDLSTSGVIIDGSTSSQAILISASYVFLNGGNNGNISHAQHSGIVLANGLTGVVVENMLLSSISEGCASGAGNIGGNWGGYYSDSGIGLGDGDSFIGIFGNSVSASSALLSAACTGAPTYVSPTIGISHCNLNTVVIANNTVSPGFRDGISADSDCNNKNIDVVNNTVTGSKDDNCEMKGYHLNTRMWGNTCNATNSSWGNTGFAINEDVAIHTYGPNYLFRNSSLVTTPSGGGTTGFKCDGGPQFVFHNSVDASGTGGPNWDMFLACGGTVGYNNAVKTRNGVCVYAGGDATYIPSGFTTTVPGDTFDFNICNRTGGGNDWAFVWNGTTSYFALSDFQTGTMQDENSSASDPAFQAAFPVILNTSPAANAGVALANFNGANSLWPYTTGSPSMGAYEANSGAASLSVSSQPQSQTISSAQTATLSVAAAGGTAPYSYQWYFGSSGNTTTPIGGATSSTYVTVPLSVNVRYWVLVTDSAAATVDSNTALVTIASYGGGASSRRP